MPGPREVLISAVRQEAEGRLYRLIGAAEIQTTETLIRADLIEYNEATGEAKAEGSVKYKNLVTGEQLEADRVEYNVRDETGRFYQVVGEASGKFDPRPGLLTTENPFIFKGEWAERIKDRYIVHNGFLTNCRLPKPVWTLNGPRFDIVPNQRAIIQRSTFRVRNIPVLYVPAFYKPLTERPRKSGFLTPNAGTSSRRGYMAGTGYYWAVNRSYDLMYRTQYFTQRGFAHHVDFRGRPTQSSDVYVFFYGVNDKGLPLDDGRRFKAGGGLLTVTANADLGRGFYGRADINYLSSFRFRQEFTESFNEAVFSEVHSVAFATRNWSTYGFNIVFRQNENFNSGEPGDVVQIRKLPSLEFNSRDRQVWSRGLPVWVTLDSSLGFLARDQPAREDQPLFQTRPFVHRADVAPTVMTALRWKDFHLLPAMTLRGTHYGSRWREGQITGEGAFRASGEFSADLILPSLARVFAAPKWLGEQVKHVVETRAGVRVVDGIDNFHDYVRFDEAELLSNTSEATMLVANRLLAKRNGAVKEALSWELQQRYFFDPSFGGAVIPGRRNVLISSLDLTGYAFIDASRRYSPIASNLRVSPIGSLGIGWRADYDPYRHRFVNNGLTADGRIGRYFVSLGHNYVRSAPALTANANQFRGLVVVGDQNKRGWNAAFSAIYDFRQDVMQFGTIQLTYNSDCCGLSVQYRRFSFGTRNENQFRLAFAIANIGSFGTLRRQERIF
ncbi:MAG: LPS-assembly protein LptD [Bryobacteraceae bacterium]|nr:LPS-assembly protein LptD [Bryobacteraceae bacterium]